MVLIGAQAPCCPRRQRIRSSFAPDDARRVDLDRAWLAALNLAAARTRVAEERFNPSGQPLSAGAWELAAAVDEAVGAIRGAIDRATDDRRRGDQHTRLRLDALARIGHRCERRARRLCRWLADDKHATVTERR